MEAFKALDLAFSALSCAISLSSSLVRCSICFVRCSISRTGRQLSIDSHCRHRGSDEKGSPLLWEREACAGEGDVVIGGGRADRGRARGGWSPPILAEPQEAGGQGPRDRAWAWRLRQGRGRTGSRCGSPLLQCHHRPVEGSSEFGSKPSATSGGGIGLKTALVYRLTWLRSDRDGNDSTAWMSTSLMTATSRMELMPSRP